MIVTFFIIAFVFCTAFTAAGVLIGNRLIANYSNPFLRSYFYYLLSFFAFAYYGLWAQLLVRYGLNRITIDSTELGTLINFLPMLGVPFLFVSWIMLIKMSSQLSQGDDSVQRPLLTHGLILVVAALLVVVILPFGVDKFVPESSKIPVASLAILLLIELLYFIVYGLKTSNLSGKDSIIKNFNLLLFLGLVLRIFLLIISSLFEVLLPLTITIYFLTNLLPLAYLWLVSDQYFDPVQSTRTTEPDQIEKLAKQFKITKREKEIIQQIAQGKTNQQIADDLFISLQTVKDHTHRIYRKIGINSRTKLISRLG